MIELRARIIKLIAGKTDHLMVIRKGNEGCVLTRYDDEGERHIRAVIHSAFEDGHEQLKSVILGATEDWLKERVVETKNFIEKIK